MAASRKRPADTYNGLLVANKQVAPGKEEEELPITPEISPILAFNSVCFN
jgi:hypothetical protein